MLSPWLYFVRANPFERGFPATPHQPPIHKTPKSRCPLVPRQSVRRLSRVSHHLPVCHEPRDREVRTTVKRLGDAVPMRPRGFPQSSVTSFCADRVIPLPCVCTPCASPAGQKADLLFALIPREVIQGMFFPDRCWESFPSRIAITVFPKNIPFLGDALAMSMATKNRPLSSVSHP